MSKSALGGVIAAIATPIDQKGEPDCARATRLARFLLDELPALHLSRKDIRKTFYGRNFHVDVDELFIQNSIRTHTGQAKYGVVRGSI